MPHFVADKVVKLMIKKGHKILNSKVLVLGITFKENCPDIRNTKVVDVVHELAAFGCLVDVHDPWAHPDEVMEEYGVRTFSDANQLYNEHYDAVVLAVAHRQFADIDFAKLTNGSGAVIFDIKGFLDQKIVDGRL
jgi:UDP-N-acetyl-D-galactosamine dehydrogenase